MDKNDTLNETKDESKKDIKKIAILDKDNNVVEILKELNFENKDAAPKIDDNPNIKKSEDKTLKKCNKGVLIFGLVVIVMLIVLGCMFPIKTTNNTVTVKQENNIVEPVKDATSLDLYTDEAISKVSEIFSDDESINETLSYIGTELPTDVTLTTYSGKTISANDLKNSKVLIEVVANWCTYCKEEEKTHIDDVLNVIGDDVKFIQLFYEGNKEEVEEFYKESGKDITKYADNIVVANDDTAHFIEHLQVSAFPSFIFFDETGRASFLNVGTLTKENAEKIKKIAWEDDTKIYNMTKTEGEVNDRTIDDVAKEIGEENIDKICAYASEDEKTNERYTYLYNVGNKITGTKVSSSMDEEIDYSKLTGDSLYLILVADENTYEDTITAWNDYLKNNNANGFVVLILTEENQTAKDWTNNLPVKPNGYILDTFSENLPEGLTSTTVIEAPSILFIDEDYDTIYGGFIGDITNSNTIKELNTLFKDISYKK